MLLMKHDTIRHWPTLAAASEIALANMQGDPDWSYICESLDNGKTWAVAVYDEEFVKVGYLG